MEYEQLSENERRRIERLKRGGHGVRAMARMLGRGIATISDELKRNKVKGIYDAKKAEHKAYVRRKYSKQQCLKVVTDPNLRKYVETKLQK